MELSVKNHGMFCVQAKATKNRLNFPAANSEH